MKLFYTAVALSILGTLLTIYEIVKSIVKAIP
jgi:hypothetical protein